MLQLHNWKWIIIFTKTCEKYAQINHRAFCGRWDATTGLGTMNVGRIEEALLKLLCQQNPTSAHCSFFHVVSKCCWFNLSEVLINSDLMCRRGRRTPSGLGGDQPPGQLSSAKSLRRGPASAAGAKSRTDRVQQRLHRLQIFQRGVHMVQRQVPGCPTAEAIWSVPFGWKPGELRKNHKPGQTIHRVRLVSWSK